MLFTMIMKAMVMPRATSRERRRLMGLVLVEPLTAENAGLTEVVCLSVMLGFIDTPDKTMNLSYALRAGCAK